MVKGVKQKGEIKIKRMSKNATTPLKIRVNDELVLDAGHWKETSEGRQIRCPEKPLITQLLEYLGSKPEPDNRPSLGIGPQTVAAMAVCLRWGSYFAVLADQDKPVWSETRNTELSQIHDGEMARINIEASSALATWIELIRFHPEVYRRLARIALQQLPMTRKTTKMIKDPPHLIALANPQIADRLANAVDSKILDIARTEVQKAPSRVLANGIINFAWRNGPVEDIHAGQLSDYPLTHRRITPMQEKRLMAKTAGLMAQGLTAVFTLLREIGPRSWPERVLPFQLVPYWMVTPKNWSMDKLTADVLLPG